MTLYYQIPEISEKDFARADFASWFAGIVVSTQRKNRDLYEQHQNNFREALRLLKLVYGDSSAEVKYLLRKGCDAPPNFTRKENAIHRKREAWLRADRKRRAGAASRQRSKEANERLKELGYEPGEHYAPSRAITFEKFISTFPPNAEYVDENEQ